jgi:GT2 family glycosyltransferase
MDANDNVGVAAPTHREMNGQVSRSFGEFDTTASRVLGRWASSKFRSDASPDPKATYDQPVAVDFVYGSFMMFRLEALAAAGGFDPNIFLFYEEMDICYRLKTLGYSAVYYPGVSFRHIGQASFTKPEIIKLESDISLLYLIRKNRGYGHYLAFRLTKLLSYGFKALYSRKYRSLFTKLIGMGPPQAGSLRTIQKCNFDYVNRC